MSIDITDFVNALLSLCAAVVTGFLVPWLKAKASAAEMERLELCAEVGVKAAEQLFGAGFGEEKLRYAESYLLERGIRVDRAAIEAKVQELFGKGAGEVA